MVGAGQVLDAQALIPAVEGQRDTPLRNAVLGYLAIVQGKAAEAGVRLGRAWELVDPRSDPATAALVAQRHVLHALAHCRGAEIVEWADRVAEHAEPGSPAAVEAAAIRGSGRRRRAILLRPHGPTTGQPSRSGTARSTNGSRWAVAGWRS